MRAYFGRRLPLHVPIASDINIATTTDPKLVPTPTPSEVRVFAIEYRYTDSYLKTYLLVLSGNV